MNSNKSPPIKLGNKISITLKSYEDGLLNIGSKYALCSKIGNMYGCSISEPLGKFISADINETTKEKQTGTPSYGPGEDFVGWEFVTTRHSGKLHFENKVIILDNNTIDIFEVKSGGKRKSKSKRSTKKRVKKHNKTHSKK